MENNRARICGTIVYENQLGTARTGKKYYSNRLRELYGKSRYPFSAPIMAFEESVIEKLLNFTIGQTIIVEGRITGQKPPHGGIAVVVDTVEEYKPAEESNPFSKVVKPRKKKDEFTVNDIFPDKPNIPNRGRKVYFVKQENFEKKETAVDNKRYRGKVAKIKRGEEA